MSVFRVVVSVENFIHRNARGSNGSNLLTLECGHTKRQKASVTIPSRCRCCECERIEKEKQRGLEGEVSNE